MHKLSWILLLAILLLPGLVSMGCRINTHGDPLVTIEVDTEPPAIRYEAPTPTPGPSYVWVAGHWHWNGSWVWIGGHWKQIASGYSTWVSGHWAHRGRHWVWVEGHWR